MQVTCSKCISYSREIVGHAHVSLASTYNIAGIQDAKSCDCSCGDPVPEDLYHNARNVPPPTRQDDTGFIVTAQWSADIIDVVAKSFEGCTSPYKKASEPGPYKLTETLEPTRFRGKSQGDVTPSLPMLASESRIHH